MASDLNEATILGNIGDTPTITQMNNDRKVANFSIATNRAWKDKQTGEWQERTEWHRVVVYDQRLIEWLERDAVKGTRVLVRGELRTRSYEKKHGEETAKHYVTEIVLDTFSGLVKFQGRTKTENANIVSQEQGEVDERIPF